MPPALANPVLQLALAAVFGAVGLYLLLPKPKIRSVAGGVFFVVAAVAVLGVFLYSRFGQPTLTNDGEQIDWIGSALFWLFSTAAVGFGVVLVAQRNPARGAIAFAFVILSTCGLFLLLAAPFLVAATIIIYAGAIVVTFLFVLMLSHVKGPSDENDRTREPLLGSLAGFAFVGLLLFTLHLSAQKPPAIPYDPPLPVEMLTAEDRALLADTSRHCDEAADAKDWTAFRAHAIQVNTALERVLAPPDRTTADERTKLSAGPNSASEPRN
jgi:NADH:ubiquinone oxidoreductase subunit 6 (subunit J)